MCGICGYISKNKYSIDLLKSMNDTMIYRGPDDAGAVVEKIGSEKYIGLAQRRLAILDLSENGHQPMYSSDRNVVITYNGEIYNYNEIKRDLQKRGRSFVSTCDTEVLIAAYEEYGIQFLDLLNGMFAFVLLDKKNETVIAARDRIGKKPLYYFWDGSTFIWGSELKPIMVHPEFRKDIRREVLSRYLCHKFICSPDSIFMNTYKVEPGQYIVYKQGKIKKIKYWDAVEIYNQSSNDLILDYNENKINLCKLLRDAVEKRLISDVPIGCFLSGGIDSTLITSIAQDVKKQKINTYTIGFNREKENEAQYAKEIAAYLGTNHTEMYVTDRDILELLEDLPQYYDEPFSDSSQIPTMLVAKLAKKDITVALTGDGGDELFCGYSMYDWTKIAQQMDWLGKLTYFMGGKYICNKMPDKVYAFIKNRDKNYSTQLFTDVRQRYVTKMLREPAMPPKYDMEPSIDSSNWQIKRMLLDLCTYLPDEILCKTDRATMKYSLEARNPLLDYRVVEYSYKIPQQYKYHGFCKKYILKELAYDYVPEKLLNRPKHGFGVPLVQWLRGTLYDELCIYANREQLDKQGIFVADEIWFFINMMQKSKKSVYSSVLWSFLTFQKWYQVYIEDLWS